MTEGTVPEQPQAPTPEPPQISPLQAFQQDRVTRQTPQAPVAPEIFKTPGELELEIGKDISSAAAAEWKSELAHSSQIQSAKSKAENQVTTLEARIQELDAAKIFDGLPPAATPAPVQVEPQPAQAPAFDYLPTLTEALSGDEGAAKAVSTVLQNALAVQDAKIAQLQPAIEQVQKQTAADSLKSAVADAVNADPAGSFLDAAEIYNLTLVGIRKGHDREAAFNAAREHCIRRENSKLQSMQADQAGTTLPAGPTGTATGLPSASNSAQAPVGTGPVQRSDEDYMRALAQGHL